MVGSASAMRLCAHACHRWCQRTVGAGHSEGGNGPDRHKPAFNHAFALELPAHRPGDGASVPCGIIQQSGAWGWAGAALEAAEGGGRSLPHPRTLRTSLQLGEHGEAVVIHLQWKV